MNKDLRIKIVEMIKRSGEGHIPSCFSIKPFDNEALRQSLKKTKRLITVEELSAHDGLFNLCLKSSIGIDGIKTEQLAIKDFLHGYGSYEDLCEKAGLTSDNIKRAALRIIGK